MLFEKDKLKSQIYADIESENLELISETEQEIHVYDLDNDKVIKFRFEECINKNWLENKIYISPKLKYKFDITCNRIASILLENLPSEYFITLEKIFIIYKIFLKHFQILEIFPRE